jgi:hypothetical protein
LSDHENREKSPDPLAIRRARQDTPPEYVQGQHQTDDLEDETHIVSLAVLGRLSAGSIKVKTGEMLELLEKRALLVG